MMSIGIPMDKKIFVKDEKNPARGGIRNDKAAHRRLNQVLEIFDLPALHGATGAALFCVFGFSVGDGLPLHVAVVVGAAGAKRGDVIDDVAWACQMWLGRSGIGAGGGTDKLGAGGRTSRGRCCGAERYQHKTSGGVAILHYDLLAKNQTAAAAAAIHPAVVPNTPPTTAPSTRHAASGKVYCAKSDRESSKATPAMRPKIPR